MQLLTRKRKDSFTSHLNKDLSSRILNVLMSSRIRTENSTVQWRQARTVGRRSSVFCIRLEVSYYAIRTIHFRCFALLCSQNCCYIKPDNRESYSSGTPDSNKWKRYWQDFRTRGWYHLLTPWRIIDSIDCYSCSHSGDSRNSSPGRGTITLRHVSIL